MTFDLKWPHGHIYTGRPARILCSDFGHEKYSIVAAVKYHGRDDREDVFFFTKDGSEGSGGFPITNAPAPKKVMKGWVNVYAKTVGAYGPYETREKADRAASDARTACLYIEREYEDGEGL